MGLRGPRPLTSEVLEARGSWRAHANRAQPEAPPGRPSCPAWLDLDAKRAWRRIIRHLEFMRILSPADRHALARYCQLWSRWKKAELFLQKYGETYPLKGENGEIKCFMPWPQVAIAGKLAQALTRLEQEFGLTPSARTRIVVDPRMSRFFETPREREVNDFFRRGGVETPPADRAETPGAPASEVARSNRPRKKKAG